METQTTPSFPYKPIRATVVESQEDWIELWKMALTPPTPEQIEHIEKWARVFFPDRFPA